jgi:hypothetical protein
MEFEQHFLNRGDFYRAQPVAFVRCESDDDENKDDEWELVSKVNVLYLQTCNPKGNSPSKDTSFICDLSLIP